MMNYDEYVDAVGRLTVPSAAPDYLPVSYAATLDRLIEAVIEENDALSIRFVGGGSLRIWDGGQSCCENRYMTTDDELDTFVGAKVVSLEAVEGPEVPVEDGYGDVHEQMFVKLETTAGTITMVTHNEHNGYYGGFDVQTAWAD
jgi:hypothetical protein